MGIEFFYCLFGAFAFVLGGVFASFAGVVAFRVPKGMSIVKPDSFCPACKAPIKPYDNIPILSYIFLRGKCRKCGSRIGVFGFLCEIFGALGFLLAYLCYGRSADTLLYMFLLWALVFLFIVIADIDMRTHDIYNSTLIIFALIALALGALRVTSGAAEILDLLIGGALGFGFFFIIQIVAKFILKRDALGTGDIFLSGIAGAFLGVFPWLLGILVATLSGSIIELIKIKAKKSEADAEIAFGPYLLMGFGIMAIAGEIILNFYWSVML